MNRSPGRIFSIAILFAVASFFVSAVSAQVSAKPPLPSTVSEQKLTSKLMGRDMPYRVIVPTYYSESAQSRYPVIFLLHGLTGHYNNWTELTKLANYLAAYDIIVVTPEGGDGWYTDSVSSANEKWESYIVKELIPEVDNKFRTLAIREKRAIAGLSMGGFGSLKFGLKYPDKFVLAGSFSGALGAAQITEKQFPGAIGKTIEGIFGPADSETRKSNDIFSIIRDLSPEKMKAIPFIYLDCGTEDFLFQNNREFVNLLIEKKVPHEYRQLPGVHDWKYWDKQVQEFLRIANRTFAGN
ncbi:MAG: esterase family protein [Pyrinomonadaceae bacterium]|nr:esterase family protein [Pyrinomonadaceae bacterium]